MCMHEEARASDEAFTELLVRLPHMPDREAYQEFKASKLWMRNCPNCQTTVCREVQP